MRAVSGLIAAASASRHDSVSVVAAPAEGRAVLRALGLKASAFSFAHGAEHALPGHPVLLDSYHCSRYNTNTRRLTEEMFTAVFARARALLDAR